MVRSFSRESYGSAMHDRDDNTPVRAQTEAPGGPKSKRVYRMLMSAKPMAVRSRLDGEAATPVPTYRSAAGAADDPLPDELAAWLTVVYNV